VNPPFHYRVLWHQLTLLLNPHPLRPQAHHKPIFPMRPQAHHKPTSSTFPGLNSTLCNAQIVISYSTTPATKEIATSTLRTHFNSKHRGSQMNDSQLQIHINKTSSQNFHWCPSKKKFYSSTHFNKDCKVPHTVPIQLTHQCIRYTILQTRDNLVAHCRVNKWKWNDFGGGGANKCFLFCISKILFGDHTKTTETKASLTSML
jgi:hypothetical protein